MRIQSIFLLIVSITLVIMSAWNLSILNRLHGASPQYKTADVFDAACHVSKHYVKTARVVSMIVLCASIIVMTGSSVSIYLTYNSGTSG